MGKTATTMTQGTEAGTGGWPLAALHSFLGARMRRAGDALDDPPLEVSPAQ